MSLTDIKSFDNKELSQFIVEKGYPRFRADQIYDWLHMKMVTSFSQMSNLPKNLIDNLSSICYISVANIEKKLVSQYDNTIKYLFSFSDKECVEAVVMDYHHGYSMCISTQVGCKMGCTFCATGRGGFVRNLTASEILSQIHTAQKDLGVRISNLVLMGMGEPLDNFENVVKFLRLVTFEQGLNIGARHITISTCGIVPKIYELADLQIPVNLALSLHAPTDEMRIKTMPINKKYPIDELLKACRYYADNTGRRITYEYAMISGVNDSDECAEKLAELLRGTLCHVNLIPVNPVEGRNYNPSKDKRLTSFVRVLSKYNINATVRRTLGSDISASCGQLRGKNLKDKGGV
ncbi:MAG: 23S rRNA (adenine(2503)-C(2))-methyltransferase RlmN [Ruminococcus sp.]|nr:23S rRNA (adenine(2503)-C(2))-methyltransferase RlmN [Ruminococcus sp.]